MDYFIFVLIVGFVQISFCEFKDISVTTKVGTFVGYTSEVELESGEKANVSTFLGIPYAEPPIGELRFKKSIPKAPLQNPLDTKKFGSRCLQIYLWFPYVESDSEDCLFLNIFAPARSDDEPKHLPVMIFFHAGGFIMWSANSFVSDVLAAYGQVIVVTLNYRLSVWGFLSTEDSNAPGNYGLWDQHLAIQWVHENIDKFGGDTSRVTVFGDLAGGESAVYQGMFPGNAGLIHRMIVQSANVASTVTTRDNAKDDAEQIASLVGCDKKNSKTMMKCLRELPSERINATLNDFTNGLFRLPPPFIPVVDNDFIEASPRDVLDVNKNIAKKSREAFASLDLMIGLNSGEGGLHVSPVSGVNVPPENFLPNKTFFDQVLVPVLVQYFYGQDAPAVLNDAVIAEYTDWQDPENPELIRQQFCDMYTDSWYYMGIYRTVNAHVNFTDKGSYMYYFDVVPHKSIYARPSWYNKAMHADELLFIFGNRADFTPIQEPREFTLWEKEVATRVMALWTNFALSGNPSLPHDTGINWLKYTESNHGYLKISREMSSTVMKTRLRERKGNFWDSLMPSLNSYLRKSKSSDATCYGSSP